MSHIFEDAATRLDVMHAETGHAPATSASTKDAGLVKFGGSAIHFDTLPATTKDSGRTKFGGSAIHF